MLCLDSMAFQLGGRLQTSFTRRVGKGQIISKGLFGILRFFQENEPTNSFLVQSGKRTNSFAHFLEESEDTKSCFEII